MKIYRLYQHEQMHNSIYYAFMCVRYDGLRNT